jgi:protein phosphatase
MKANGTFDEFIRPIAQDAIRQVILSCLGCGLGPLLGFLRIIRLGHAAFAQEPPVLHLNGDFCVVGDLHGDIDMLLRIFAHVGFPPRFRFLFLGDYVDRGSSSCEVIILLYSLKLLFPGHIALIRGNHEFQAMTSAYGFHAECTSKGSEAFYRAAIASFEELPLAAILNGHFCVHGGISSFLRSREDLDRIQKVHGELDFRFDLETDLLWSDPSPEVKTFAPNPRGAGCVFSARDVANFMEDTSLSGCLIRAHEACPYGYECPFGQEGRTATVFSSCDYCGLGNQAAVAIVTDMIEFQQFPLVQDQSKRKILFPPWLIESPEEHPCDPMPSCVEPLSESLNALQRLILV